MPKRWLILVAACATLLAGCGSSATHSAVRVPSASSSPSATAPADLTSRWLSATFLAKANAICTPAEQQQIARPFPFPSFDPASPDPRVLPQIEQWARGQTATRPALDQLIALTPHETNAGQWAPIVTALKTFESTKLEEERLAGTADAAGFAAHAHTLAALIKGLLEDLIAAGFQPSDDCYTLFSD